MSKESALIFLGIFIAVVPFLGIPDVFRTTLIVFAGVAVFFLSFLIYAREKLLEHVKAKRRVRGASRQASAKPRVNESADISENQE